MTNSFRKKADQNSPSEIRKVKNLKYGQPARRIADNDNPVDLGEEERDSYTDQSNKKGAAEEEEAESSVGRQSWKH